MKHSDDTKTASRGRPPKLGGAVPGSVRQAAHAARKNSEARALVDSLRVENEALRSELAALRDFGVSSALLAERSRHQDTADKLLLALEEVEALKDRLARLTQ